jgi:Uma2 family endonuclease
MAELMTESELSEVIEPDIEHLVTEDDTPVDNIFSERQQRLLTESLYSSWKTERPYVALANVGLFYAVRKPAVVPDVFVSLDVELPKEVWEKRHRSYFLWEYGKPPEIVIEIVSNRKGGELEEKRQLYAQIGVAYYVVFDPAEHLGQDILQLFELQGRRYVSLEGIWLPELKLGLMLWEGEYEGVRGSWLRWCDANGDLLLTGAESAQQERERAEKLAAQLRALGIEPET